MCPRTIYTSKTSKPTIMPKDYTYISDFIAEGKIKEVLDEIRAIAYQMKDSDIIIEVESLSKRYTINEREKGLGILSNDESKRESNKITVSLLNIVKRLVQPNLVNKKNPRFAHRIYLCNRDKQDKTFQSHLIKQRKKIHTFFIHGDERHGHEAMSQRFYTDVAYNSKVKPIEINLCAIGPAMFKRKLIFRLMEEFGINNDETFPQNLGDIYKKIKNKVLKENKVIGVILKVPCKDWFPQDDIKWFYNIFCNEQSIPKDAPNFHFYFLVEYRTTTWLGFFKKRKLKKYKEATICKLRETSVLEIDELGGIKYDDIDDWLSDQAGIKNPGKRKQIIKDELRKAKAPLSDYYYMEDLVKPFNRIINRQINTKL